VLGLIESWLSALEGADFARNPLHDRPAPHLDLVH
jgi:hypothetical protein